jgi:hypothetical protein
MKNCQIMGITTAKRGAHYLPSVSFLIGRYGISEELLHSIQGTGPKNRILKGDVLALIKGGVMGDFVSAVENEAFYSIQLNLDNAHRVSKSASVAVNELVAAAAFSALHSKKGNCI